MTTRDPLTAQERALQERLQAALVPPATPDRLRYAIDELALDQVERRRQPRWAGWRGTAVSRRARVALAMAAVIVLVAGTLLTGVARPNQGQVAGSPAAPSPLPNASALLPSPTALPGRREVNAAAWISPTQAWAEVGTPAGVGVSFSDDGGVTWTAPYPEPGGMVGGGLTFLSRAFGYSVATTVPGAGWDQAASMSVQVSITTNGGQNWTTATLGSVPMAGSDGPTSQVHFSDEQHGVVLAGTWAAQASPTDGQTTGDAPVRCAGWTTDDGGTTWAQMASAPCAWQVRWATPMIGIAFRNAPPDGGRTAVTRDGGRTWTEGSVPGVGPNDFIDPMAFTVDAGRLHLILMGPLPRFTPQSPVLESADNGATWRVISHWVPPSGEAGAMAVLTVSDWLGAAIDPKAPSAPQLVESRDGGLTWSSVAQMPEHSALERWYDRDHGVVMQMVNGTCSDPTLACGPQNLRYLTSDGGLTWRLIAP